MAVKSSADIVAQLLESAKRMREVRAAAELLSRNRRGPEPDPRPLDLGGIQPTPGFTGQVERPNLSP